MGLILFTLSPSIASGLRIAAFRDINLALMRLCRRAGAESVGDNEGRGQSEGQLPMLEPV